MAEELSCETCGTEKSVVFCEGCNDYYCDKCWPSRRAHRTNTVGPTGIPHNMLDPQIVKKVQEWMAEPENESDERKQHALDGDSVWFGLSKDEQGDPVLAEYRRVAILMMETSEGAPQKRYPGLVSFVGPTGAGKSSLIRLLLDAKGYDVVGGESPSMAMPVIGRKDQDVATSADVHLYVDPNTCKGARPILFADCEGFEGGERDPVAQAISDDKGNEPSNPRAMAGGGGGGKNPISRIVHATKRALRWASRNSADYERTCKRQFAVTEMYPRIFHAFSDVVVFVLNNSNTLEDVAEKLLLWADKNHSASINLPSKPHAVIALNKSTSPTSGDRWSRHRATEDFFKSMDAQILKNKTFEAYAKKWARRNLPISSMQELFERYYSSVHVIRLPEKSRYQLLHKQRDALRGIIDDCCEKSLKRKSGLKMLPDVDQFQMYVSLAFDHFSETLNEPFDYVKASLKYRPPPETLADNLLEFVVLIAEKCELKSDINQLFSRVTDLVASCIMLDSARKQHFGGPQDWFGAKTSRHSMQFTNEEGQVGSAAYPKPRQEESYRSLCKYVITEYYETRLTCSYNIPSRPRLLESGFSCELTCRTHGMAHQGKWALGRLREIGGKFNSNDFHPKLFDWEEKIRLKLLEMYQSSDWNGSDNSREARAKAHGRTVHNFYMPLIGKGLFCNSVCLSCLFNPAQYPLNCGHLICTECAKDFGRHESATRIVIDHCPISGGSGVCDQVSGRPHVPTVIHLEPAHSGLRVLTLDGGGVRGIVELVVLKAIEDRIGIPIQRFFDLVVGTSTGGIISLGFGHKQWSVDECIQQFQALATQAFTARHGQKYHGINYLELLFKKSRYETKPLVDALQNSLGSSPMFGSPEVNDTRPLKVAVTATSDAGTRPYVLSNYNVRRSLPPPSAKRRAVLEYTRHRPSDPKNELAVWQAARATSAAPGYFKPFEENDPQLMDGAILHNNPIKIAMEEARSIAVSGNLCKTPDIVLSLGTGLQNKYNDQTDDGYPKTSNIPTLFRNPKHKKISFISILFTMVKNQIQLNLDAEKRWETWYQQISDDPNLMDRSYRINPDLGVAPPLMDEVDKITFMMQTVAGWANTNVEAKDKIGRVACTLVASSFYFERRGGPRRKRTSSLQLNGVIRCRLENPAKLRALGKFINSSLGPATFVLINTEHQDVTWAIPIREMVEDGTFEGVPVGIAIPDAETLTRIAILLPGIVPGHQMFDISGFPRKLMRCDFGQGQI